MNLKQQLEAALQSAREIAQSAKGESRNLTDAEVSAFDEKMAQVDDLKARIKAADESTARYEKLAALSPAEVETGRGNEDGPAKSLGEHFAKHAGEAGLRNLKSRSGYQIDTPEWAGPTKAATDANTVGSAFAGVLTEVDQTIVRGFRRESVADVLGSGSISGTAITYFIEGAVEGSLATVAELGQKPQLHFVNPTTVTDSLKKIAGWWDTSDEMVEDLPYMVSEINNRGLYLLSMAEEAQLLNGNGSGTNVLGLLNRSGIQTVTQASTGFTGESAPDAIFRAMTAVQTATGLDADAIIINPADYQALRLSKDANGQYYGGGYFSGAYGVGGGITPKPPLWGLRTVVSAAVAAKTVVVGNLSVAATVYRKGGVRVESTNSDQGKFTTNVITTRIEERVALAVRMPLAVVKVTLS